MEGVSRSHPSGKGRELRAVPGARLARGRENRCRCPKGLPPHPGAPARTGNLPACMRVAPVQVALFSHRRLAGPLDTPTHPLPKRGIGVLDLRVFRPLPGKLSVLTPE